MNLKGKLFGVLSVGWAAFIFSNSFKPGAASTALSNPFVDFIQNLLSKLSISADTDVITVIVRKSAHFAEFFLFGLLVALFLACSQKGISGYFGTAAFLCLLCGTLDEFIQSFIVGRSSEVMDIIIDFGGGILACIIVLIIQGSHHSRRKNSRRFKAWR